MENDLRLCLSDTVCASVKGISSMTFMLVFKPVVVQATRQAIPTLDHSRKIFKSFNTY